MARRTNKNRTGATPPEVFPNDFSAFYDLYSKAMGLNDDPFQANRREIISPQQAPWAQSARRNGAMTRAARKFSDMNIALQDVAPPPPTTTYPDFEITDANRMVIGADPLPAQVPVPAPRAVTPNQAAFPQLDNDFFSAQAGQRAQLPVQQPQSGPSLWDRFRNAKPVERISDRKMFKEYY